MRTSRRTVVQGRCGGTPKHNGDGRGRGNFGTSRQPVVRKKKKKKRVV